MGRGKDRKPRKRRDRGDPEIVRAYRNARRRERNARLRVEDPEAHRRRLDAKNARKRELHQADPSKARERDQNRERTWRRTPEGRVRVLVQRAKKRAVELGIEFDLHRDDLYVPTHCPVLGIPLNTDPGGPLAGRFSLDRTDSRKGYVKGNVQIISFRANTIKGNATAAELRAVADYVEMIERLHALVT